MTAHAVNRRSLQLPHMHCGKYEVQPFDSITRKLGICCRFPGVQQSKQLVQVCGFGVTIRLKGARYHITNMCLFIMRLQMKMEIS
jgi:hypothetical protein